MKKLGLNEIREKYLAFFESKGHLRLPSFPLIPRGDRSLLLINSGMAPLKPYFSGEAQPPRKRITTCQKCIRTPDIERVGKTSRHGTFFEMLGNFSFGDYFKREATAWAWEFVTRVLEIPEELLYVSVYLEDDEAYDIWTKEVGVSPSHMVRLGKADNFWEIGPGPCGPSSEIYFDRGPDKGCGRPDCAVGCDCDRYVEFWNLVFTQFNSDGNGNYSPLSHKNIDTGMGLERIACIMQGVGSLFEVDTIRNVLNRVSDMAGVPYGAADKTDVSLRIITDHIRSTVMMVSDGIMPSNEGRGYVLRRILRRAARHGRLLGIEGAFLWELSSVVVRESAGAYPELAAKKDYIAAVIRNEEENFGRTIGAGIEILSGMMEEAKSRGGKVLSGEDAFRLYDTFGFPVDLTVEILGEQGMTLDREGFDARMSAQRERAREARAAMGDAGWSGFDFGLGGEQKTEFLGYDRFECTARVLAVAAEGELRSAAFEGERVSLVLDRTVFYAESGGQTADRGVITADDGLEVEVEDVKKTADGKFAHTGTVRAGELRPGKTVTARIDLQRRRAIMRAHSSTHLLQKALRSVLGEHVEQAGSLVEPDRLRFDFTHFSAPTPGELAAVEEKVNEAILAGYDISIKEMPFEEAKKLGAMALFGEKYGERVRVVDMGGYSVELCGGTHLDNTAKAGLFSIVYEGSISSGVRRIEAVTGKAVLDRLGFMEDQMRKAAASLKASVSDLAEKAEQTAAELKEARKEIERLNARIAQDRAAELVGRARQVGDLKVMAACFDDMSPEALRLMGDSIRSREALSVALLATAAGGRISFAASCGPQAVAKGIKAGDIVRRAAAITGGSGGGKPDSAMAGGKDLSRLSEALESVFDYVSANAK